MNIGYPDTKNKQGGGHSPLQGRYKNKHGESRGGKAWRSIVGGIGKGARAAKRAAKKVGQEVKSAWGGKS